MRIYKKLIIIVALLFIVFDGKSASCRFLGSDGVSETLGIFDGFNGAIPQANIKVYKRWDEEDISWKTWFIKGYTPVLVFLLSSFGLVILLSINNIRLKRMIKKSYQDSWEAEENYYRLLEIVNDAVLLITHDGTKIFGVNRQLEKLSGYKRLDLLEMTLFSLTLPEDEKKIKDFINNVKEEGTVLTFDMGILDINKNVVKVSAKGRFIKGYTKTVILLALLENRK